VLCVAAQRGSERALKALLDGRANLELTDEKGWSAAHHAAAAGRTTCLRRLLDAGAIVDAGADAGYKPLHLAAQMGHVECCSLLLAMGSDANARTTALGGTPLIQSILFEHEASVRVLLPASDLSITNKQGRNAFHVSICTGNLECFELLLPLISDVDVRTVEGVNADGSPTPYSVTPLHLAGSFGQERMLATWAAFGSFSASRAPTSSRPTR